MSSVTSEIPASLVQTALDQSSGEPGWASLSSSTRTWLGGLSKQLPPDFTIYKDGPACELARKFGAAGFAFENHIVIDTARPDQSEAVLRHELVHLAQFGLADRSTETARTDDIEAEAHKLASLPFASPARCAADRSTVHMLFWFLLLGTTGVGVAASTTPANAPEANGATLPPKSEWQIFGDTLSFVVVPGGAMALGSRLGLGFLGSTSLAGAATGVSLRASSDVGQGSLSSPLMYVTDALTGAVIGWVVPGGIRFIGRQGTVAFDKLSSWGLARQDIKIARTLYEAAHAAPLDATAAQRILQRQGLIGGVSKWWLDRRQLMILYRGQSQETQRILSPLARETDNVVASEELVRKLLASGAIPKDIATAAARAPDMPILPGYPDKSLVGIFPGKLGIPTTRLPSIASGFGPGTEAVVYVIRVPKSVPIRPSYWPHLKAEQEWIILNQIPKNSIVKVMPARDLGALKVNNDGLLAPGYSR